MTGIEAIIGAGVASAVSGVVSATTVEYIEDGKKSLEEVGALHQNYERLKEEAKKLSVRRNDVQTKIDRDKTKHANEECVLWMSNVNKLEKDVEELIAKFIVAKNKNKMVHFDLNRSLKEKCDEVRSCWGEGSNFATVVVTIEKPPEPIIKMRVPKIDDKPSLQGIVEEVLETLRDKHVKRIGLWGIVGVGKTAILENLNNNDQIADMFEIVIFATITEGDEGKIKCPKSKLLFAREKLQHDIVRRLKLDIGKSPPWRQSRQKYLQSWQVGGVYLGIFDLEDIGIRGMVDNSKIVLASRHRYILYDMDVEHDFNVKPLSKGNARNLFREKLSQKIDRSFDREAQLVDRVARAFRKYRDISQILLYSLLLLRRASPIEPFQCHPHSGLE